MMKRVISMTTPWLDETFDILDFVTNSFAIYKIMNFWGWGQCTIGRGRVETKGHKVTCY